MKPAEQKKSRHNGKTQNTPKGPQTELTAKAKPVVAPVQESEPDVVEQESVPVEEPRAEPVPRARANDATVSPVQAKADEQAWTELKITHAAELAEGVELGKRFDQEAVFRRGHDEAPIVTALTAQYFTQLRLREGRLPQLPVRGFAVTTIAAHRRALRKLMEIPEKYRNLPIDEALVMYFTDEAVAKNWQPTTTTVKMATTHGALRILPVYARGAGAMMLKESVLWMQAMKGAARAAKEHRVNQPLAATWDEVKKAIQLEANRKVRMALLLTWLTCGRGGDVLLLQPRDVECKGGGRGLHLPLDLAVDCVPIEVTAQGFHTLVPAETHQQLLADALPGHCLQSSAADRSLLQCSIDCAQGFLECCSRKAAGEQHAIAALEVAQETREQLLGDGGRMDGVRSAGSDTLPSAERYGQLRLRHHHILGVELEDTAQARRREPT